MNQLTNNNTEQDYLPQNSPTPPTSEKSTKPKKKKPSTNFILTERDIQIINSINRHKALTWPMVQKLNPGPRSKIQQRLKLLSDQKHIKSQPRSINEKTIYRPKRSTEIRQTDHKLNCSLFTICLEASLLEKHQIQLRYPSYSILPFNTNQYIDPDRLFFIPIETEDYTTEQFATLEYEEIEDLEKFRIKVIRYFKWWDTNCFQPLKQARDKGQEWPGNQWNITGMRILVTASNPRHLENLMRTIRESIPETRGHGLFWFHLRNYTLENPHPILDNWRTPRDNKLHNLLE